MEKTPIYFHFIYCVNKFIINQKKIDLIYNYIWKYNKNNMKQMMKILLRHYNMQICYIINIKRKV